MSNVRPKHKMWQYPWGYRESGAIVCGIVIVGLLLQVTIGSFDFYLLAAPVNLYAGAAVIVLSVLIGVFGRRSAFGRWFASVPLAVSLLVAFVVMTVIMGLTMQTSESHTMLGVDTMTRNWAFVFVYLFTMLALGALIARRFTKFKWRDGPFFLNHIGLWLLLASAGLGYADMERYVMHVTEGETEWRVFDEEKNVKEMPLAIQLNDFDMDVYPPKLAVISRNTGDVMPAAKPEYFQIDEDAPLGTLNGWTIELREYIHTAVRSSDSTYQNVPMSGSTPAALVVATKGDTQVSGWICAGSMAQLYMTLPLDSAYSIVMTAAEPRSFSSDIEVFTEDGQTHKALLEVNRPLRVGSWMIYQYGYDNPAGKLSSYSSFELVYDPWMIPVYVGVLMLLHGMGLMIWLGRNKKEVLNDVE